MNRNTLPAACLALAVIVTSGCLLPPIPSKVLFHRRESHPILTESAPLEKNGAFSCPAFNSTGEYIAVYNSGINRVQILRSSDLSVVNSFEPVHRPMRLSFSPSGNFLIVQTYQRWVEDYLTAKPEPKNIKIDSPDAVRDDIQEVEVWYLRREQTFKSFRCSAEETTTPKGRGLWARKEVLIPGYRSSAILLSNFSSDDSVFSILCHSGTEHQWNSQTWQSLKDISPPPFWRELTRAENATYWAQTNAAGRSNDGRIVVLILHEKKIGSGATFVWDRTLNQTWPLPRKCSDGSIPIYSTSADRKRLVLACGSALRVWDLESRQEIHLKGASFGLFKGMVKLRGAGVAISPDGRYVAAALLHLVEAIVAPGTTTRDDLRIWDLTQGEEVAAVPIEDLSFYTDYPYNRLGLDLAFSPDSAVLAVGGKRLRLYRTSQLVALPH
jgi:WD40 repeat protein